MPDKLSSQLTIVSISSEVESFAKAGGLADVSRALPKAIQELQHNVIAIMPLHKMALERRDRELVTDNLEVKIDDTATLKAQVYRSLIDEKIPLYLIDADGLFSHYKKIYGSHQENRRFYFFNCAVLTLLEYLKLRPDVLHCHDWETGLIPQLLHERYSQSPFLQHTATLFTIHNLVFQLGKNWWEIREKLRDDGKAPLPPYNDPHILNLNFARRAIRHADAINAVSEQYAEEILTSEYGQDLEHLLRHRKDKGKLFGVVNGVDYHVYNPLTDPGLVSHYDANNLGLKTQNKLFLQHEAGLPEDPKIPLIGMVTRITEQKGFDLLAEIGDRIMRMDVQLVVRGDGDKKYESVIRKLKRHYPKKVGAYLEFNTEKATQVYAGSDIFLVPSRFEPCGLGQLISLRYGTIPVVHSIGGLADTITDYNPRTGKGNGFTFKRYDAFDFLVAIARAVENHRHREAWLQLMRQAMEQSFSWKIPAQKYVKLYRIAIKNKQLENNNL